MGKLKTHKGVKKRFTLTGTGKLRHRKAGRRHLLAHKSGKRMRKLRLAGEASKVHESMLRRLLGK